MKTGLHYSVIPSYTKRISGIINLVLTALTKYKYMVILMEIGKLMQKFT